MFAQMNIAQVTAEVKSYPWRRILMPTVVMLLVVGLGKAVQVNINDPQKFPVTSVDVKGNFTYLNRQEVVSEVSAASQQGFFQLDLDRLIASLEALPWVKTAAVRRYWPDSLSVEIVEQQPFAFWGDNGLVSIEGQAFFPDMTPFRHAKLATLAGPENTAGEMTRVFRQLTDSLASHQLQVAHLKLSKRKAWEVELSNGLLLKLGRDDPLERVQRLMWVYESSVASKERDIEYIDLRYPNGFAVQWRTGLVTKRD